MPKAIHIFIILLFIQGVYGCSDSAFQVKIDDKVYNADTVRTIYNLETGISYLEICLSREYSPEIETDVVWMLVDVPLKEGLHVDDMTELMPESSIWFDVVYEDNSNEYWTTLFGEGCEVEVFNLTKERMDVEFRGVLADYDETNEIKVEGSLKNVYISYDTLVVAYSYPEVKTFKRQDIDYFNKE